MRATDSCDPVHASARRERGARGGPAYGIDQVPVRVRVAVLAAPPRS